jgi:O-acetyl-ADP-ribose deacetylase (regulator of RNase III)
MREERVDILSDEVLSKADAVCFTSNGIVKANGQLVMGGGVAKLFVDRWPELATQAGALVRKSGNRVYQFVMKEGPIVVSFPTKHHFKDASSLELIQTSAKQLMELTDRLGWQNVYLTRPGVGLGRLSYAQVKPVIDAVFDDRIVVCYQ